MKPVFLDYHSSTPLDKRVEEAMRPFYSECFYNPSSRHSGGEKACKAVERARNQVAGLIGAKSDDIYFTNGATEANNLIIRGLYFKNNNTYIISSNIEHSSIYNSLKTLPSIKTKFKLPVSITGEYNNYQEFNDLISLIKSEGQILVSIIHGNNEIGTIQDIKTIGQICKSHGVMFHSDITQSIGKVPIDVDEYNLFSASFSGHKIYGPKGVGILFIRDASKIEPLLTGGFQNTISSGTLNVPAIVGLGKACEILKDEGAEENKRIKQLRDYLLEQLLQNISDIYINGTMDNRLSNNLNVSIKDVLSEALIEGIDDIMLSSGSACVSGKPSRILQAINALYSDCAIRFGLGRYTTIEEIDYAVKRLTDIVKIIRKNI